MKALVEFFFSQLANICTEKSPLLAKIRMPYPLHLQVHQFIFFKLYLLLRRRVTVCFVMLSTIKSFSFCLILLVTSRSNSNKDNLHVWTSEYCFLIVGWVKPSIRTSRWWFKMLPFQTLKHLNPFEKKSACAWNLQLHVFRCILMLPNWWIFCQIKKPKKKKKVVDASHTREHTVFWCIRHQDS